MEDSKPKLPRGWEILLAIALLRGVVKGKVRLQKVVSEMQGLGLPVDHIFIIHNMGPYSTGLEECAHELEENGLITIKKREMSPLGYSDYRYDYYLTKKGVEKLKKEILPAIREEYYYLLDSLRDISKTYANSNSIKTLVEEVHKKLHIEENFTAILDDTIEKYRGWNEFFSEKYEDYGSYCMVWIAMSGLSDLVLRILEEIRERVKFEQDSEKEYLPPEDAGRYWILTRAEEGLKLLSKDYPFEECKAKNSCISKRFSECKELELKTRKIFFSIEQIAKTYGYDSEEHEEEGETEGEISVEDLLVGEI